MPRGGRRQGTPGANYSNRSDLQAPKPLAPTAAPGQTYGVAAGQLRAEQAVPMAPPPSAAGGAGPPGALPSPPAGPLPGASPLGRTTERPNEPVTHGLPVGPGAGPEALGGSTGNLSGILRQAAQTAGSTDLARLADMAQARGQ